MRGFVRHVVLVCSILAAAPIGTQGSGFQPKCPFPFNETPARQTFDDQCNQGKTKDQGTIVQDAVKDDFCVTGSPITVDIPTLKKLQTDVESRSVFGPKYKPPTDRSALRSLPSRAPDGSALGEGLLVRIVAFVFEAHYSDVSSGESVNCKIPGKPNNDIHMALVASPDEADECQSVTTEITPHYRPAAWTDIALNAMKGTPVRITGQLFFDASHHPCSGGNRPSPLRQSSWEIHPLYKFEVCTKQTLDECKVDDDGLWVSLSDHEKTGKGGIRDPEKPQHATQPKTLRARVGHVEADGSALELLTDGSIQNPSVDHAEGELRKHRNKSF